MIVHFGVQISRRGTYFGVQISWRSTYLGGINLILQISSLRVQFSEAYVQLSLISHILAHIHSLEEVRHNYGPARNSVILSKMATAFEVCFLSRKLEPVETQYSGY